MDKKFLKDNFLLFLIFGSIVVLFALSQVSGVGKPKLLTPDTLQIVTRDNTELNYMIEVARTPQEHETGLMYRREMPENTGMLFLFDNEVERSFWMKNTYIPLDIIFIRKNGEIANIHENAVPLDQTQLPSSGPIAAVFEINGGEARKNHIAAGDIIRYPGLGE